uniref:RNA-directed DNA polymerase, eukaryota, reverse transcriptase zinc-binding domain protein n=1 Tax=Tanacetum cinerariifolium TaxID=118510 RepID=A0A699HTB6_TANCI|nr:RNA-directed DNA polymerase, eukaryota, reverse transcriptase zinc-binding domain protein [Tanacetum cinerariifolium]
MRSSSIKQWIKDDNICLNSTKLSIQNRLSALDKLIDQGRSNEDLVSERSNLLKDLHDLNSHASLDMIQKAKIRWAIEGDENSKYFLLLSDIERDVTYDEIKNTVWDCGPNRSLGLDGFTFEFFRRYWKTIDDNVVAVVLQFFTLDDVQLAFVSNRQILDVPFVLNELLSCCKHKKSKAMIFKDDFEKAFDSVRWVYLDDVLNKLVLELNVMGGFKAA